MFYSFWSLPASKHKDYLTSKDFFFYKKIRTENKREIRKMNKIKNDKNLYTRNKIKM